MARVIRKSRWLYLRWAVFLFLLSGVLSFYFLSYELDAIVHQRTLETFQEKFSSANVYVSSAHLKRGEGIELSQFVLLSTHKTAVPGTLESFPPVLEAENVRIECPSRIEELAAMKEIPISSVTFDDATIHTYRRPDGSWSLDALKTNSEVSRNSELPAPVLHFQNTTIVLHDMTDRQSERKLILHNVEMTIDTAEKTQWNSRGISLPDQTGLPKQFDAYPFRGSAESKFTQKLSFSGKFYPELGEILVEVDIDGLQYSEEFRNAIPMEIAERFQELKHIRGEIDAQVKVAAPLQDFASADYFLAGKMTDGRSADPRFPKLVSSLATDFQITNDGFHFPNLNVRFGDGQLELNVQQRGYGPQAARKIVSKIREIELSEGFFASLPENLQRSLGDLSPAGRFNMDAVFLFDGTYWTTNGKIVSNNLSITHPKFPYRLENLQGQVELKGNQVHFQFRSGPQNIQIQGNFTAASKQHPQPPSGSIRFWAQDIPIDDRLLNACPGSSAEFIRSLEPAGNIHIQEEYRFSMTPNEPQQDLQLTVDLLKNSCRYRAFPYPLRNLEGKIFLQNDLISAQELHGTNGNAEVRISFRSRLPESPIFSTSSQNSAPLGTADCELTLTGTSISLDDDLYANLPQNTAEIFRYIQPYGAVDIRYEYRSENSSFAVKTPDTSGAVPEHTALRVHTANDSIQLSFPKIRYRLDDFKGSFLYQNGQSSLSDFSAAHGSTRFSGKVSGTIHSAEHWDLYFDRLIIDELHFDRELMGTIPQEARVLIASRRPDGALYFNGTLRIARTAGNEMPFSVDWSGDVGISNGSMAIGTSPISGINGGIQLAGHWDEKIFYCGGELQIDSLFYQNIQFTDLRGPLWIDNRQLLLGGEADPLIQNHIILRSPAANTQKVRHFARSLNAKFAGGDLSGTFALQFGYPSTFQTHIILTNGQLENCTYLTGNDELKGKMYGSVTLTGNDHSVHSLRGKGDFHLSDADIYKLGPMMSLLKILSLKEVNDTGFSSGDMEYRIEGNHIYFNKIDFYGDAFSLIGTGEMDFKSQVALTFYSVMGRNDKKIPIISPLLHMTGRQMMLINMKGPIQNPAITTQPLPALNMAIQQMEEELPPPPILPRNSRPGMTH